MNIEYELPKAAASQLIRESLLLGPSLSLAQWIAKAEDFERFTFLTFGREGLSDFELLDFAAGNKAEGADDWLAGKLKSVPLISNAMLIVEDWMASPHTNFIKERSLPAIFLHEEVYYLLREWDPKIIPHWKRMFTNAVPSFHAFLLKDDPRLVPNISVNRKLLEEVSHHLRMIICGAYDGESYVLAIKGFDGGIYR